MKKRFFLKRLVSIVNIIVALLLLLACSAPYISVKGYYFLTILSTGVPLLVISNAVFILYWILKKKWGFLLSTTVLVIGYFVFGPFYKIFPSGKNFSDDDLIVMSYNVRTFNRNGEIRSGTIFNDIKKLVDIENPDIICFQEPGFLRVEEYEAYPYKHLEYVKMQGSSLMGLFSKYPIIRAEEILFPESHNYGIYADILYKKDTIRVYNLHLESLGIQKPTLSQDSSSNVFERLITSFQKQQEQAHIFLEHSKNIKYSKLVCGDFNNSQFSAVYKTIRGDMNDSFLEEGSGQGATYSFFGYPVRIDFILADPDFEVRAHQNFEVKYSDHYPVVASFRLKED